MAKALLGHVYAQARSGSVVAAENHRLRRRVEDLEALVAALQAENDRLAAAVRTERRRAEELQPA